VLGLGVSVPGVIRGGDGNVRFAPNLGWRDAPFGDMLCAQLPSLPITVGNDGDLGVLAEHARGVARSCDDVVFVEGETGVGCGVIVGGRPLVGAGGYAGELGHMTVRVGGRRCRCGAAGCWETEIGAEAIARALGLPSSTREDDLLAELRLGGPDRVTALSQVALYLGTGLSTVVNMLNPRMIVLGGLLRQLYPLMQAEVLAALSAGALAAPAEQLVLTLPQLGGDAVLLGAAEAAWERVLSDPVATLAG
jgi:predicted NBD/HSP70 family sugar kinase